MFEFYSKENRIKRLSEKYDRLLDEAFELSTKNLVASKDKYEEAKLTMVEVLQLKKSYE